MTFKLGILEVGRPPENLRKTFGDYPSMFEALLKPRGADWHYMSYPVVMVSCPKPFMTVMAG